MMRVVAAIAALAAAYLAGCASFDGGGFVPGKSGIAEIEAGMGMPDERLTLPNGDTVLYFSRLPAGRAMYAVTIGADGVMKSIEQRLTRQHMVTIRPGTWTKNEVRALLGPPGLTGRLVPDKREWWEYKYRDFREYRVLWVQFSEDGVAREVIDMQDPEMARPG